MSNSEYPDLFEACTPRDDVLDLERRVWVEDDLQRAIEFVSGLTLEGGWNPERFEERLLGVDVLLAYSDENGSLLGRRLLVAIVRIDSVRLNNRFTLL